MKKLLFAFMLRCYSAILCDDTRILDIAQQMRALAPQCQYLSSEAMRKVRRQFLENNKNATIEDLVGAIDTVIDNQNIIDYFRSFGSHSVCEEHIQLLLNDKPRGARGIYAGKGKTTIDTLLYCRFLSSI